MIKDNEKVGAVMVVGSGIAGIQASLDLANSGMKKRKAVRPAIEYSRS